MRKILSRRNRGEGKLVFMLTMFVMIFCATGSVSAGNDGDDGHYFWVNLGVGMGMGADPDGDICSSPGIVISYLAGTHLFSLRYAHSYEINILGPSPSNEVLDIGVLYGIIAKNEIGFASVSAGLGGVKGIKRVSAGPTEYIGESVFTTGVPLEAQLFWNPVSFFGLGLYAFANANLERPFGGVLFCVQAGNLPVLGKQRDRTRKNGAQFWLLKTCL